MLDDLSAALRLDAAGKRALLVRLARARPLPLSLPQRRLWLLEGMGPPSVAYNVPAAYRLRGPLDVAALAGALDDIVQRHDVLRSVVSVKNGEAFMQAVDGFAFELARREVTAAASLHELLEAESARSFDLTAAPPIRALLVRVADEDYVLLVTIHHIATDGWSMDVFGRELSAFYAGRRSGARANLPEPRARYADFAREQHERRTADALERDVGYWREALRDAPPQVAFGAPPEAAGEAAAGCETALLAPPLRAALRQFARARHATLFSTLLSLWYLVLARATGQRDLVIGSAASNRTRTAYEDVIGFFVNTLPLRARIDFARPFADVLAAVHATALDAFEHAELPLERIVAEIHPARLAGRAPLVNVMFVLQNGPAHGLDLAGLDVAPLPVRRRAAKFDLLLEIADGPEGLTLNLEYRAGLFAPAAVRALLDAFAALAGAVAAGDVRPAGALPMLGAGARRRQLAAARGPSAPLSGLTAGELFERQVRLHPHAVALEGDGEPLTYGALNERANRLAHHLRALGVSRGSRVGIALDRGAALVTGILAIVKAGGVYVPLDAADPRDRLAFLVADAGLRIVLTDRRRQGRFRDHSCAAIALDADPAWRGAPAVNAPAPGSGGDPAYVMYTSGSTGTPKGVLVAHRGIERLVTGAGYIEIGARDAVAFASSPAFDAATFELWGALLNGARLVVIEQRVLLAPGLLAERIATHGISIMFVTTALFREIVRKAPGTFGRLRVLLAGGEKLDRESVCRLAAGEPPAVLVNGYGPTETTTFAAAFRLDPRAPLPAQIPIGGPIGNTELLILDERLELLPAGASGQLYIGGPGLALSYLNDPARTAQRFIAHPFAPEPGARLYATGDLARYGPDGAIEFLGRRDGQIKRRGFRIEIGEIETALRACAGVSDAAVVPRIDAAGDTRLAAYVTPAGPGGVDRAAIAAALRARLPAHVLPDSIDALERFPLTRSGKLDGGALPPPGPPPGAGAGRVISELQQQLVSLWEALLGVAPIGIRDDFFALGGHSLLAVRLAGEIERQFGVRIPLAALFERPTVEALAELLRADPASLNASPVVALNARAPGRPFIFLHGSLAGGGYYCRGLAERLPERPFLAVRPHGVDGRALPPSIEAIAAECVAAIMVLQPAGPYLLGGFCSGGLVAFEIAAQLARRGESIDHLVLIDVPHGGRRLQAAAACIERLTRLARLPSARRAALRATGVRFVRRAERFLHGGDKRAALGRFVRGRSAAALQRALAAAGAGGQGAPRAEVAPTPNRDPAVLNLAWTALTEAYVPQRYSGRLTVLLSEQGVTTLELGADGWLAVAPQVEIRAIPGAHLSCITDHIGATADAVAAALKGETG